MKETIVSILKPFAELCYKFAVAVSPTQALIIYIAVLAVLAVWAMTLKQEKPSQAEIDRHGKAVILIDLRFWAVLILVLQIIIYLVFR